MQPHYFQDQAVIITGASSGIGRAVALQLAAHGVRIALASRDAGRLEETAAACRQSGGEALVVPTDVSQEAQCRALVEQSIAQFGRLDMLVNNAGIGVVARFADQRDLALFQQVMAVNFYGSVFCTYYALPYIKQSHGRIVAVSSLGGKLPLPYNSAYIASKHALHGFYDSLRMELATSDASITVICPYWVVSEFHERQVDKDGRPRGKAGQAIYTKRMMTSERCASILLEAAAHRRREVLMWPGMPGVWLRLLAPRLMEQVIARMVLGPVIRRSRQANK